MKRWKEEISDLGDVAFPPIIHQTWKTEVLSTSFKIWSDTWKKLHPTYEHKLWTDKDNHSLVREFYPDFLKTYEGYNKNIKRVDAVRPFYLYKYGGIYADLDFECLKSFEELLEKYSKYDVILGKMRTQGKDITHSLPNALMISKPAAPFWLWVIKMMKSRALPSKRRAQHKKAKVEWQTGPQLLYAAYQSYPYKEKIKILPSEYFYSIGWSPRKGSRRQIKHPSHPQHQIRKDALYKNQLLTENEKKKKFPGAYALTYWAGTWKE